MIFYPRKRKNDNLYSELLLALNLISLCTVRDGSVVITGTEMGQKELCVNGFTQKLVHHLWNMYGSWPNPTLTGHFNRNTQPIMWHIDKHKIINVEKPKLISVILTVVKFFRNCRNTVQRMTGLYQTTLTL